MGIYVGGSKYRLVSVGKTSSLFIPSPIPITNGIRLLTSDDYILQDKKGLYITTLEYLLSSEDEILKDKNDLYLVF